MTFGGDFLVPIDTAYALPVNNDNIASHGDPGLQPY